MRSLLHHHVQQWLLHHQLQQRGLHHDLRERLLLQQLLLYDGQRSGDLLRGRRGHVAKHRDGRRHEQAGRHQGGAGVERLARGHPLTARLTTAVAKLPPGTNSVRDFSCAGPNARPHPS